MPRKRLQYIFLLLFLASLLNIGSPCLPAQAEDSSILIPSFRDITGHWAEREIKAWTAREMAGGYPDGTFRPGSPITRAEFVTLVNRAFGYTEMTVGKLNSFATSTRRVPFRDVAETDWYIGEIANAAAVGYFGGYPDGTVKPQNPITRQEVATVLARVLPPNNDVHSENSGSIQGTIAKFADQDQIPEWSEAAIAAAVSGGYMSGYPDGTFQPTRPITRAEALTVLDRAVGTLYNRAGTYGPFQGTVVIEGNATISTPGVTLQNTTITGDLYLTEGIGEGDVALINVTVQGITKIAGGGRDSIHLRNTSLGVVLVNVPSHKLVRVLAQGDTAVGPLEARTPARLEEEGLTGSGFTKVVVNNLQAVLSQGTQAQVYTPQEGTVTQDNMSQVWGSSVPVELLGQFSEVEIQSPGVQLNLQRGGIESLTLASPAQGSQFAPSGQLIQPVQITLAAQTAVKNLVADSPATVQGQGTVETTQANVDGVVIGAQAKKVLLADGVQANVAEKNITENYQYVELKKKSKDVMLSNLTINGTKVAEFAPDTLSYELELPYETTEIPTVGATAQHAKEMVGVTQATGLAAPDNIATVLVTAENGRTQVYTVSFTVALNSAKAITAFSFTLSESEPEGQVVEGIINEAAKTITVTVSHGTDVTALVPTIIHTGESISPGSGEARNFSAPVIYTVTAADGTTAEYTVTVYVAPSTETTLNEFKIGEFDVLGLPNVMVEEGATLAVSDISDLRGITVRPQDDGAQLVVTINGTVPEGDLDGQKIEYSDVIVVTVTAADRESMAQYKVTVVPVKATGVNLNKAVLFLKGITIEEALTATIEPANATNKGVTWASDNPDVATVDNNGKVTAVALGMAKITVTTADGGKTAFCWVKVVASNSVIPVIDDYCVLYLDGREGTYDPATNTWYDLSGKGHHGTLHNFDNNETSGWKTGNGLQFDGQNDYVQLPNLGSVDSFTIACWFNSIGKGSVGDNTYNSIIGSGYFNRLVYKTNTLLAQFKSGNNHTATVDFPLNTWGYITYTYDATTQTATWYLNGEKINESQSAITLNTTNIKLGAFNDALGAYLHNGFMRDITIYSRALKPHEIAQNYFATENPESLSPVEGAILELDGAQEAKGSQVNEWTNQIENNNHATLQGFDFDVDADEGDGWTGKALKFDGTNSYAEITDQENQRGMTELTLECWYRPYSWEPMYYGLISKWTPAVHKHYILGYVNANNSDSLSFFVSDGVNEGVLRTPLPVIDQITHITATFVGGESLKIYYNGVLQGSKNTTITEINNDSGEVLYIGRYFNYLCDGAIYKARIYPRALTDREVMQNYLAEKDNLTET
jgi:uncharacterized protein YjdB